MYQLEDIDVDWIHSTKFSFTSSVELDCTPEQLFDVFEDAESWPVWVGAIQNVEWTSPKPFGLGTTRTVTMSGDMAGYEEFIAWERGKHMAFKFVQSNKDNLHAFGEDYVVTDLGNGRCRLDWTIAMGPKGASKFFMTLAKPIAPFLIGKITKELAKYVKANVTAAVSQAS